MCFRVDDELCARRRHAFKINRAKADFSVVELDEDVPFGTNFCDLDNVHAKVSVRMHVNVHIVFGQGTLDRLGVFPNSIL